MTSPGSEPGPPDPETDALTTRSPRLTNKRISELVYIASRSRLRSASSRRYETPATRLKIGKRCFSFAGPAARNSLPASLQDIRDHRAFKRNLKTELLTVYTRRNIVLFVIRYWSRGVSGALEKRELELVLNNER